MRVLLIFLGMLLSSSAQISLAFDDDTVDDISNDRQPLFVSGEDIKVEVSRLNGGVAEGRIMIKVAGQWYSLEKPMYIYPVPY